MLANVTAAAYADLTDRRRLGTRARFGLVYDAVSGEVLDSDRKPTPYFLGRARR